MMLVHFFPPFFKKYIYIKLDFDTMERVSTFFFIFFPSNGILIYIIFINKFLEKKDFLSFMGSDK